MKPRKLTPVIEGLVSGQTEPFRNNGRAALTSSASEDAYTPPYILAAAREALGGVIDLDPASCAVANEEVRATRFYTKEGGGLFKPWGTRKSPSTVWLNPPGGFLDRETMQPAKRGMSSCVGWWWALNENYREGLVRAAIFYVFRLDVLQAMRSDPSGPLPPQAHPFCLFDDRPRHWHNGMWRPGKKEGDPPVWVPPVPKERRGLDGQPTHACGAFYLGPSPELFARAFAPLGYVRL